LAEPDLPTVVGELAAAGHRSAVVVPLLFTSAYHAGVDVPEAVRAAATASGVHLLTSEVLGTGEDVAAVLLQTMAEARIPSERPVLLYAVGSSNADANAAVHALADRLTAIRGGRVLTGFGTAAPRAKQVIEELTKQSDAEQADAVLADAGQAETVAIVPLFLAPGLLLEPMEATASARGWIMTPALGARMAPIVLRRYRDRTSFASSLG
jgi:sirohydrochlorin cobaltochelatase